MYGNTLCTIVEIVVDAINLSADFYAGLVGESQQYAVSFIHFLQVFLKDVRFFINSVTRAVDSVRSAGLEATCTQTTEDGNLLLTIVIPKAVK